MRHVFGFIMGLLLVPVILVATGWSLPRISAVAESGATFVSVNGLVAIGALGAVALVVALMLVPPRLTPLVPGVAGLALVGLTAVQLLRPALIDLVPRLSSVPGVPGARTLLEVGLYLPLALVLVVPLVVPSRWQSYRPRGAHALGNEDDYDEEDDEDEDYDDYRGERSPGVSGRDAA